MMRLPPFRYVAAASIAEAAAALADHPPGESLLLAGGTDLLPNMKRRQQTPKLVVGLRSVDALKTTSIGAGAVLGAGLTLARPRARRDDPFPLAGPGTGGLAGRDPPPARDGHAGREP